MIHNLVFRKEDGDKTEAPLRHFLFNAEEFVVDIENNLDRTLPNHQVYNLACEAVSTIAAAISIEDQKHATEMLSALTTKLCKDGGMERLRAVSVVRRTSGRLTKMFRRAYGERWKEVVSKCNIAVRRRIDLVLQGYR